MQYDLIGCKEKKREMCEIKAYPGNLLAFPSASEVAVVGEDEG